MYTMTVCKKRWFKIFFPIFIHFILFSYNIALATMSSTMLNINGVSGHFFLFPITEEKIFNLL